MPCHWFLQRQIFTPIFFFSSAWDCTEGIEMDYLGLQLHNIQREEQLESEIQKMKRHQHDQLDLPAILYNFMCCLQNMQQRWRSRCAVTAIENAQPKLFHYYFMFPSLISSSHLFVVVSVFVWCRAFGEGLPLGTGVPHILASCTTVTAESLCDAPTEMLWKPEQLNGDTTKTTLSHTLQLPLNFCILCFFWH